MIPIYCSNLPGSCFAQPLAGRWFCECCGKPVAVVW